MPLRSTYRLVLLSLAAALERTAAGLVATLGLFFLTEVLGLSAATALSVLGTFQALTYLAGIGGGIVADRLLGRLPTMLIGAAVLALGYLVLASAPREQFPFAGLLLIAGHGLFKPSLAAEVSSVGTVLAAEQWYYFAANVGLALGPLLGSLARGVRGWPAAFALSAAAVALALPVLLHYRSLTLAVFVGQREDRSDVTAQHRQKAGDGSLRSLAFLLVAVVVHGVAYHQVGGSLLLYASECSAQSLFGVRLSPSVFGSLPAVFTLLLMPPLAGASRRCPGLLAPRRQLLFGSAATAAAFAVLLIGDTLSGAGGSSPLALVLALFVITLGEVLLLPTSLQFAVATLPPAHRSLAAALWCGAVALGQWLAALVGGVFSVWSHANFFALMGMVSLMSGVAFAWLPSQASRSQEARR